MSAFTWPPERPDPAAGAAAAAAQAARRVRSPRRCSSRCSSRARRASRTWCSPRRRADLRRHAGEISFPGGRRTPRTRPRRDRAARGRGGDRPASARRSSLLGELPPTSTFVTNYVIHPFVATIPAGVAWRLSRAGGRRRARAAAGAVRTGRTTRRSSNAAASPSQTDAYVVDEHIIWGATARIIENLLERLSAQRGPALALAHLPDLARPPRVRPEQAPRPRQPAGARSGGTGGARPSGRPLWPARC